MATNLASTHLVFTNIPPSQSSQSSPSAFFTPLRSSPRRPQCVLRSSRCTKFAVAFAGGGGGTGSGGGGYGGQGGGGEGGHGGDGANEKNREEALLALGTLGRSLESLPSDLAAAIQEGRIPGEIVYRFSELERSPVFRWLLQFGGFKERLLADDLFLAKVAMECGVGIFTKTAAEYERRREKFVKELDFVLADVVMAIIADFMLVWLPAPTVSLKPPLALSAGPIAKFFHTCPDNAFQRNGLKLFAVGTSASLIGTGVTNGLINARKAFDKNFAGEAEDVPIISTSVAYGVYMAISSNLRCLICLAIGNDFSAPAVKNNYPSSLSLQFLLRLLIESIPCISNRYQILAGVIEQWILEPLLHEQKLILSALCFAVRTGNTFLGSLM
ncbi:RETICULATA-RELATED 4 protein [Nymphaea thermarum]|nr:RETICULATA-RELATED 4 protein [Nymphaea thermarum]